MLQNSMVFFQKHALKILICWVIVLAILYSCLSVIRHNHFQSGAYDLGIYDQATWQYSQLLYPFNTIKERFILGDHLTLTLPFFAPLFYFWNNVQILLIFQALWMSISAIPVFLFIQKKRFKPFSALLLSVIYSLFFGIQYAVYFDFHPVVIGAGILPWIFYFLEAKKQKLLWMAIVILLLTQENMGIALAGVGLCYIFSKGYRKYAILFIVGGIVFSLMATKVIALFSPVGYEYTPHFSTNIIEIIRGFFDTDERRQVWLYSLSWFSFLPLLSPGAMLAVVLDLSQYFFLGREFSWMQGPFLHHRAILGIFLLVGVVQVLEFLRAKKIPTFPIILTMFLISLFLQYHFHFPLDKLSKREYLASAAWMDDTDKLIATIPQNVSVASSQNLVPHMTHRKEIYLLWPRQHNLCNNQLCWWLDFGGKPAVMIVNLDQSQWVTQLLETPQHFSEAVKNMEKSKKITLLRRIGMAYEYKINY